MPFKVAELSSSAVFIKNNYDYATLPNDLQKENIQELLNQNTKIIIQDIFSSFKSYLTELKDDLLQSENVELELPLNYNVEVEGSETFNKIESIEKEFNKLTNQEYEFDSTIILKKPVLFEKIGPIVINSVDVRDGYIANIAEGALIGCIGNIIYSILHYKALPYASLAIDNVVSSATMGMAVAGVTKAAGDGITQQLVNYASISLPTSQDITNLGIKFLAHGLSIHYSGLGDNPILQIVNIAFAGLNLAPVVSDLIAHYTEFNDDFVDRGLDYVTYLANSAAEYI